MKVSKKEMHNTTKHNYNNLPEIQGRKEEARKREEKIEDLKRRQEKVKELDIVNFFFDNIQETNKILNRK